MRGFITMDNTLYCGAAKGCITPDKALLPNLHALRAQSFGGVLDDIYVRALAVSCSGSSCLIVMFDLDKVPYPARFTQLLSDGTGVPSDNIILAAIHTHTAPITGDRVFDGPNNISGKPQAVKDASHAYEAFLEAVLLKTAKEAISAMVPSRLGTGAGTSYINVCRCQTYEYTDPDGRNRTKIALGADPCKPIDHTVSILEFEDLTGKPIAFFINYPVHCSVLHACTCLDGGIPISGDISGHVCRCLEAAYPGAVSLWSSGAAGDINPIIQNELNYPDPVTGDHIMEIIPGGDRYLLDFVANQHYSDIKHAIAGISCTKDCADIKGATDWIRVPGRDGNYEVRMQMLRIGSTVITGASGELYNYYGRLIKDLLPGDNTIVMNHVSSLIVNSGYIPDDDTLSAPETDLPGLAHTNMLPGYFTAALKECVQDMYNKVTFRRDE